MNSLSMRIVLITLCFFVFGTQAKRQQYVPKTQQQLTEAIASIQESRNIPGLAVGIVEDGRLTYEQYFGHADTQKRLLVNEGTQFRIASVSKIFVSVAVMQLVEKGVLSLEDLLADLAPEIEYQNPWSKTSPIKLKHLLEHTTGWDEQHYPEFAHNQAKPVTLKQAIDFHPHSRTSRWVPGSRYAYNNVGQTVAAHIVEKKTGLSFETYVQQYIFKPMGMSNTGYFYTDTLAQGYSNKGEPMEYLHLLMRPTGAVNSTLIDMTKMMQMMLAKGVYANGQVLEATSIERIHSPKSSLGAKIGMQTGYGLANYSSAHGQFVYREHNGGLDGWMSEFAYLPQHGTGHVILMNTKDIAGFQKISRLVRQYSTSKLGAVKKTENDEFELSSDTKQDLSGLYVPINPRVQLFSFMFHISEMKTLHFEDNTLIQSKAIGSSRNRYSPVSKYLFRSEETGLNSLAVVEDPLEGTVVHYAYGQSSRQNYVLKKISPWLGYGQLVVAILWLPTIVISLIYSLFYIVALIRKRPATSEKRTLQLWLSLPAWVLFVVWWYLGMASEKPYELMAEPTFVSVGIMLMTVVFAMVALGLLLQVIRLPAKVVGKKLYCFSLFVAVEHSLMTVLLANFGVIGIMFWA